MFSMSKPKRWVILLVAVFLLAAMGGCAERGGTETKKANPSEQGVAAKSPAQKNAVAFLDQGIDDATLKALVQSGEIPKDVTKLNLDGNQISDLTPLQALTNLTDLQLDQNQISDPTPLQTLPNLTVLNLGDNHVSDLTLLQSMTNLTELELGNNKISDITPLQSMTNLTKLGLYHNKISDIAPLQALTNLTELELGDNQTGDLTPLRTLINLTVLYLDDNQLTQAQLDELQRALPGCEINFFGIS
jgi:Leucine-rich repeat (LRR) protein